MHPAGYLYDPQAHAAANARGENYWFAYVQEVFRQLGLPAQALDAGDTAAFPDSLRRLSVLVVGDARSADPTPFADDIARWVRDGGILIGFATHGLDDLFGNAFHSLTPQRDSAFHMTALLRFRPHALTTGVYTPFFADQPLPLFSPLRKIQPAGSEPLADLLSLRQAETPFPALTRCPHGRGWACYFGFDLPQTLWVLHKGRPVDADYDLDGYLRLSDAIVTGTLPQDVPFADELLFVLQNLLHQTGLPMLHQLPPAAGEVADLVVFFGGDDEGLTDGSQVAASDFMKSRGLPYHINIMPYPDGHFGLTRGEHDHIVANGHEASLHYNFMDGFHHPGGFTQEDVQRQCDWFCRTFGHEPVATVNHWCRWCDWTEPACWMHAAGGKADNSRLGVGSPPLNPVNHIGFAFGTAFPHYYYEDWRGENRRLDFLAEPIVAYEVGYLGDATDFPMTHRAIDLAAHYHLTANFFQHPIYFAQQESSRRAIDELLRYLQERQLRPVFLGCDALWEWWDARSRSALDAVTVTPGQTRFLARCEHPDGMVVKVPAPGQVVAVEVGGRPAPIVLQRHFALPYVLVVCPLGESVVTVRFT